METLVLRAPEDSKACWDLLENQDGEVEPELTEPEVCLESLDLRATEALTVFLVCLETKVTGATQAPWDLPVLREKTERGEMTETSAPGVCQVNPALVVCSAPKVPLESPDLLVFEEMMETLDPKETWVHKESLVLQDSRGPQELRECQGLRERLDLQERKVPQENQDCQECPELMVLLVTPEKRDQLEPKETRVPTVLRELLVILALVASRERRESVD